MADFDFAADTVVGGLEFDSSDPPYSFMSKPAWPMPVSQSMLTDNLSAQSAMPLQATNDDFQNASIAVTTAPGLISHWSTSMNAMSSNPYSQGPMAVGAQFNGVFGGGSYNTSPIDFMSTAPAPLQGGFDSFPGQMDQNLAFAWDDHLQQGVASFAGADPLAELSMAQPNFPGSSPTETWLEVRSLPSAGSDGGWATVDYSQQPLDNNPYPASHTGAVFNPGETLHLRTHSESSRSDAPPNSRMSWRSGSASYEEIQWPHSFPQSDTYLELSRRLNDIGHQSTTDGSDYSPTEMSPVALAHAIPVEHPSSPVKSQSPQRSPIMQSPCSPPNRRQSKKSSPIAKSTKPVIRRPSHTSKKEIEKRVGRRKGPLLPEQRKQASEIRKLRACLRCKFLKKTCDKGEPCAGCQPSHARLWQVPCTRIDIKEIGYFMKGWKADFERHVSLGFSVGNIKGFGETERSLYITHGYGYVLPVKAREVYVRDESCFDVDWTEAFQEQDGPQEYEVPTAKLSAGMEGISTALLSEYLDRHIDGGFERFVDEYFDGTKFLTEMLKTTYRYYLRTKLPVIRKALKLVLAYNLTLHVTMVEGLSDEDELEGRITDESSRYKDKVAAPVMINFQIKCALADMWRELQKDILEELSALYSSVYSGEKLKNWPTIFFLAAILLLVWEEMQFDCHYRVPDTESVQKFCKDMETIPVGVIVGLFSAISQKLPPLHEWDTSRHHHVLNSNPAVCEALTEVRQHILTYDTYLKSRSEAQFDRKDFDCLSNKFLSKLVLFRST